MTKSGPALFKAGVFVCVCLCWGHPKQGFPGEVTEAAMPVNNNDSNHMCLWCYASSPVQHQGLLKDKWLLIKHILPPHLSLSPSLLSVFLRSPPSPAPTWGGQVARPWGGGIGRLHAEIDYPSNLRTASVSPGQKLRHESPPLPRLPPLLFLLTSSLPLPPSPSSLCPCAARGTEGRH